MAANELMLARCGFYTRKFLSKETYDEMRRLLRFEHLCFFDHKKEVEFHCHPGQFVWEPKRYTWRTKPWNVRGHVSCASGSSEAADSLTR